MGNYLALVSVSIQEVDGMFSIAWCSNRLEK